LDNKPLEELAENYIKTRLTKADIKFLKPNYDTDGTDLVLLNPINKHYSRQVIVQSKGRNLSNNPSNVSISKEYVVSNFVCFLYLEIEGDPEDYFYIFFSNSIIEWNLSDNKYILSIPKSFKTQEYFLNHKFNPKSHVAEIKDLLNNVPIFRQSYIQFEKMELTEILFEMWKKYDSLPDLNLVRAIYDDFYSLSGSYAQDIFLIFTIGMHIENLEYRTLDGFMQDICQAKNLSKPISESVCIINPENIKQIQSSSAIVYSHLKFGQVDVNYDGIDYKALYCYIGDREDYAEALLFENGDYVAFSVRK
jgi:hypothetical protein